MVIADLFTLHDTPSQATCNIYCPACGKKYKNSFFLDIPLFKMWYIYFGTDVQLSCVL